MNEVMIMRRGGGGELFAAIGARYPVGNTCSCTNGKKTLVAKDASGQCVFAVPKPTSLPESWTVTTTADGGDSKSKSVNITAKGQCELVNLASVYLFKEGAGVPSEWTALLGGFTDASVSASNMELSSGDTAYQSVTAAVTSASAISLKGYSRLVFDIETNDAHMAAWVGVSKEKFVWSEDEVTISRENSERYTDITSVERKEVSVDISALDDDCYVFVASEGLNVITKVYNIWLE